MKKFATHTFDCGDQATIKVSDFEFEEKLNITLSATNSSCECGSTIFIHSKEQAETLIKILQAAIAEVFE